MAHFLITSDIEKRQPYLSYLSEYGDEEPETGPGCPKCHFHKYDYSFLSRLGSPWLAHKSQLKFHLQRSSPLELACYLSTENFDESKIGLLSDSENLLERSFFFFILQVYAHKAKIQNRFVLACTSESRQEEARTMACLERVE